MDDPHENERNEIDKLCKRITELERFKALALRTFAYPREIEMMAGGLSPEDRRWFRDQFPD